MIRKNTRPGITLVELLIFIAIIAIVGTSLVPLLFSSAESRLLQESIAFVETNGSQVIQIIGKSVREADRILLPAKGGTGHVLMLQMSDAESSPVVFGTLTGAVLKFQHEDIQTISGSDVSIENFSVRNTGNGTSTGVYVSFVVSRTIRLRAPRTYRQTFQTFVGLYPKDVTRDCACECTAPVCSLGGTHFSWYMLTPSCGLVSPAEQLDCGQ